jgi:antitoxin (DNA-binding transcriptional repressor) of toxin-antitoxin stability system
MTTVNIFEAKTHLSRLIEAIETGAEAEIIIARNGRPVARLAPLEPKKRRVRLGLAKGMFEVPDNIDEANPEIARLFGVAEDPPE